jgi:hypothetical protein
MVTTTVEGTRALRRHRALSARIARRPAGRSRARCWCRCTPAWRRGQPWCRWGRWRRLKSSRALRPSAPRMRCSRPTSTSTSASATSAPTLPTRQAVNEKVKFPPGYYITWSGQFEYMERAIEKLKVVMPLTLLIHFPAPVSQLPAHDRDADRDALGALRPGRRRLADVAARLQPLGGRGGGLHCPGRRGGRDRRGDADLPRPRLGSASRSKCQGKIAVSSAPTCTPP